MANNKTSTKSGSTSQSSSQSGSTTNSSSQSVTNSSSHTQGGSHSYSYGKSWASGKVDEHTQAMRDKYNQDYKEGNKVTDAYSKLQEIINGKPTFESSYEEQLKGLYDQIMNRDAFSYDFNADQMYQMYKNNYMQQGETAMQDTMGQAAAMTGGYGSSYGQSVGQQTYQNYLQRLNDVIPQLRDQAYQQYKDEGTEMLNKYNVTTDAYDREYGQYRDEMSDWQSDRGFQQGVYTDERNFDYSQFTDNRNYWNDEYWNEKNAERSNYQITDTTHWSDTTSTSVTNTNSTSNTSQWDNSVNNTSNWSNTSYSAPQTTAPQTTGDESSNKNQSNVASWYDSTFANQQNNTWGGKDLNVSPYNISSDSVLGSASNADVADMIKTLQSAGTATERFAMEYQMKKELGMTDAEIKILRELAEENRDWNGIQLK